MRSSEYMELLRIFIDTYDSKLLKQQISSINKILSKFDKETVECLLFNVNENGIKEIDSRTLIFLRANKYDMKDISFDNVLISGNNYTGLKNLTINIDRVYNKDISKTTLNGIHLIGNLDNAIVNGTNFEGYIGRLTLNPQKIRNKDLSNTNLNGIIIDGIFDGCDIFSTNFNGALGGIYINPQKIKNKDLERTNLDGVHIIGENGKKASFNGCKIKQTSFKGAKGVIEINPQELASNYIMYCNFDGVTFTGCFDNLTLFSNDFINSKNAFIDLNKVKDPYVISLRSLEGVEYIPLREKEVPKPKILSLFKRKV